jgi:hypothetical protein
MRRALQISDGQITGLFNTAFSITIYVIIALLVLWPLVNRVVVRRLRPTRHELHAGHAHALVELAEELVEEEARREPALSGRPRGDGTAGLTVPEPRDGSAGTAALRDASADRPAEAEPDAGAGPADAGRAPGNDPRERP